MNQELKTKLAMKAAMKLLPYLIGGIGAFAAMNYPALHASFCVVG